MNNALTYQHNMGIIIICHTHLQLLVWPSLIKELLKISREGSKVVSKKENQTPNFAILHNTICDILSHNEKKIVHIFMFCLHFCYQINIYLFLDYMKIQYNLLLLNGRAIERLYY